MARPRAGPVGVGKKSGAGKKKAKKIRSFSQLMPLVRFRRIMELGMRVDNKGRKFRLSSDAMQTGVRLIEAWMEAKVTRVHNLAQFSRSKTLNAQHVILSGEIEAIKRGLR